MLAQLEFILQKRDKGELGLEIFVCQKSSFSKIGLVKHDQSLANKILKSNTFPQPSFFHSKLRSGFLFS